MCVEAVDGELMLPGSQDNTRAFKERCQLGVVIDLAVFVKKCVKGTCQKKGVIILKWTALSALKEVKAL